MAIPQWIIKNITESTHRRKSIKRAARDLNINVATVYRAVQKYEKREKELRIQKEEKAIANKILALKKLSRGGKHQRISTKRAISEAIKQGLIPDKRYNRARIDEIARFMAVDEKHLRMPKPCVRLMAPGPNTWAQVDFTVAQCFYLKNMRVHFRDIYSKKEPKKKILLGTYVDMYSGCKFWYAYEAMGESAYLATDFLYRAFIKKNATFPMYGLPWNIYCDQGSPFKAKHFRVLLDRLGIQLHLHKPKNARATGMAEKSFQQTQKMEALLRVRTHKRDWPSIEDFNRWLFEFAVDENNEEAGRSTKGVEHKRRFKKWCEIHPDDLRICPPKDIFMNLTAVDKEQRRVHQDLHIYYGNKMYHVGVPDLCMEKVNVFINVDGKLWIQHPLIGYMGPLEEGMKANVMGVDFGRPELSYSERNIQKLKEIAEEFELTGPGQYYSRKSERVYKTPATDYTDKKIQITQMTILEAKMKISEVVGIPLGQMPESTREIIDEILRSNADDGMVSNEIIEEICGRIKETICLE